MGLFSWLRRSKRICVQDPPHYDSVDALDPRTEEEEFVRISTIPILTNLVRRINDPRDTISFPKSEREESIQTRRVLNAAATAADAICRALDNQTIDVKDLGAIIKIQSSFIHHILSLFDVLLDKNRGDVILGFLRYHGTEQTFRLIDNKKMLTASDPRIIRDYLLLSLQHEAWTMDLPQAPICHMIKRSTDDTFIRKRISLDDAQFYVTFFEKHKDSPVFTAIEQSGFRLGVVILSNTYGLDVPKSAV